MSIKMQTKSDDVLQLSVIPITDEITDVEIKLNFGCDIVPEPVKIKWFTGANGGYAAWSPLEVYAHGIKPNWQKTETLSRSAFGMPMQQYISADGENAVMVSVADARIPLKIRSGVVEETGNIEWELVLFSAKTEKMEKYSTVLRIDERKIAYEAMIKETAARWRDEKTLNSNPHTLEPVYSTWYAYHQQLTLELLCELKAAAALGMKTVIIDDGWQTDDNSRGYAYCGTWKTAKSKIPDMKAFVKAVHEIGMKVMLWYSVPFVGVHSEVWKEFKDKLLYDINGEYGVLDPRYPQVREYLISIYEQAVKAWELDGLKLDFIDCFELRKESCVSHPDMDTLSVEKAVCSLLEDICSRLTAIKSDMLIEFRQNYIGPLMMTYGNMLRAGDCPMDAVTNRIRTVNLRLTSGKTTVHSDMLMWNYEETAETVANQLINVLFSVPQISIRIEKLSKAHYAMLCFYLKLWESNREIIMSGNIRALHPEANYTLVYAEMENKLVAVAYGEKLLYIEEKISYAVFINGTGTENLYLETEDKKYNYGIYNCMGQVVESGMTDRLLTRFKVPVSGVVMIWR